METAPTAFAKLLFQFTRTAHDMSSHRDGIVSAMCRNVARLAHFGEFRVDLRRSSQEKVRCLDEIERGELSFPIS